MKNKTDALAYLQQAIDGIDAGDDVLNMQDAKSLLQTLSASA